MRTRATPSAAREMIHVAIIRVVREGQETEFERLIEQFFHEATRQPGVCGAYLIRPLVGSNSREYGILRSFQSVEDMNRFYESDIFRKWNEAIRPLVEGEPQRRELHGMEAFFREGAALPPRWKMAIVTWIGVSPAVYIFSNTVPAVFGHLSTLMSLLLVNALVVATLTWVFMPLLTKLFHRWLHT